MAGAHTHLHRASEEFLWPKRRLNIFEVLSSKASCLKISLKMKVFVENGAFVFGLRLWCPREEHEDGRRFLSVSSAAGDRRRKEQDAQTGEYLMFP